MSKKRRQNLLRLVSMYGTQKELAEKLGIAPAYLSQLCLGNRPITEKTAAKIEATLKLNPGALSKTHHYDEGAGSVSEPLQSRYLLTGTEIPLLTWAEAGDRAILENLKNINPDRELFQIAEAHSDDTICLQLRDESMVNQYGRPSYHPGDIVVIDMNVTPQDGDHVMAMIEDDSLPRDKRITFKALVDEGSRTYLRPLNTTYAPIMEGFSVLGVCITQIIGIKK